MNDPYVEGIAAALNLKARYNEAKARIAELEEALRAADLLQGSLIIRRSLEINAKWVHGDAVADLLDDLRAALAVVCAMEKPNE